MFKSPSKLQKKRRPSFSIGAFCAFQRLKSRKSFEKNGGAWFSIAGVELHVSPEKDSLGNKGSKRHVCYVTSDIESARTHLIAHGIEIKEDKQPIDGWIRFYIRDPGDNRLEIAQRVAL